MGRLKKRGTSGNARNYLTRSQAVRKLQISLGDFRRLCIFKGIYPREPRSKKRVSKSTTPSTTFYYAKDIQYLLHEPLLAKFRDHKALAKKISKALGRNEISDALRWEKTLTPKLKLDHVIKERYPTFVDALRDLDDALSMLFLFATLPSTAEVPAKIIARCQRLTMEFEHYLIRTHSLRKTFLSIKGIYYQATIQGQDILWLAPYKFVQRAGADIDFRIMATFVEFYTTLLGFVNFRLYTGIGLVYPPRFDKDSEEKGAELGAFRLEGRETDGEKRIEDAMDAEKNEKAQAEADRLLELPADEAETVTEVADSRAEDAEDPEEPPSASFDQFAPIDEKADALLQPSMTADASSASQLFESFTFFLAREAPLHPLEFILKAFGCKRVGWDSVLGDAGSYCSEDDNRITHQIVDRPDLPLPSPPLSDDDDDNDEGVIVRKPNERVPGRIYVQPQWVWDSINTGQLQRPDLYAPGATLPPHLSPWVRPRKGEYDPTIPLAQQETAEEAEMGDQQIEDVNVEENGVEQDGRNHEIVDIQRNEEASEDEDEFDEKVTDMQVELAASDDEDSDEPADMNGGAGENDEWGGLSGDEADIDFTEDANRQAQAELDAEVLGRKIDEAPSKVEAAKQAAQARRSRAEREAQEDVERRKMMMPKRKRKIYEKMVYSNARKDEEAERLRAKRRRLEKGKP